MRYNVFLLLPINVVECIQVRKTCLEFQGAATFGISRQSPDRDLDALAYMSSYYSND